MAKKINNLPFGDDYAGEMKDIANMRKPKKMKMPKKMAISSTPKKKKNPMDAFMKKRNKMK